MTKIISNGFGVFISDLELNWFEIFIIVKKINYFSKKFELIV